MSIILALVIVAVFLVGVAALSRWLEERVGPLGPR